jgi:hypothetical protein
VSFDLEVAAATLPERIHLQTFLSANPSCASNGKLDPDLGNVLISRRTRSGTLPALQSTGRCVLNPMIYRKRWRRQSWRHAGSFSSRSRPPEGHAMFLWHGHLHATSLSSATARYTIRKRMPSSGRRAGGSA